MPWAAPRIFTQIQGPASTEADEGDQISGAHGFFGFRAPLVVGVFSQLSLASGCHRLLSLVPKDIVHHLLQPSDACTASQKLATKSRTCVMTERGGMNCAGSRGTAVFRAAGGGGGGK